MLALKNMMVKTMGIGNSYMNKIKCNLFNKSFQRKCKELHEIISRCKKR